MSASWTNYISLNRRKGHTGDISFKSNQHILFRLSLEESDQQSSAETIQHKTESTVFPYLTFTMSVFHFTVKEETNIRRK